MNDEVLRFSQVAAIANLKRHTVNARAKSLFPESLLKRSEGNQVLLNPNQVKKIIGDKLCNLKGKVIYIGNLKGGVGKTTLAYLLASSVNALGIKTCIIDLDVQANLTQQYMDIDVDQPVFFDVIDNKKHIQDTIVELTPNLHIIPSSLKNSLIQKSLSMQASSGAYQDVRCV